MKKITLIALLLMAFGTNAQSTFAIYTEDPDVEAGVNSLRFSNGAGFSISEPTTAPYEGTKNYRLTFDGTSSYYHGILFPRNATNTADMGVNLQPYSYYNLSIKTASAAQFYIRIRGNAITAKVLIDPAANSYGFSNNNQWHMLSIPIADFIPESQTFSLTTITEAFVLRSNASSSIAGTTNNFEIDNIYASVEPVLGIKNRESLNFDMYPNPSGSNLNISTTETIQNISIYSLLGQKVIDLNPSNNQVNMNIGMLPTGVYLVTIASGDKTSTRKLVKK